jgi:hypothetical protein
MPPPLQGFVFAVFLYDVCEEIRLDQLREQLDARRLAPAFKHKAPEYVRFMRPPVVESLDSVVLRNGERFSGEIKYYDYGVISVVFERPFAGDWNELAGLSSTWLTDTEMERYAAQITAANVRRAASAMVKPYPSATWLNEDYFIFHIAEIEGAPTASELMAQCGGQIAQVVRGETTDLSPQERGEVLQSGISYYPNDLTVIGWNAAFVYDSPAGAATSLQMLEYANSQLLEYRHYDEYLTRELDGVYRILDRGTGLLARWRLVRAATRLHTVTLDITELSERADNAIKFLSDMYAARLYRLASKRIGTPDYRDLVDEKLRTARDLYEFLVTQFQQARAFILELMVVIILVIDLIFLFRGK